MNYDKALDAAIQYIDHHINEELDLDSLATKAGYSLSHFHVVFRDATGQTLGEYIRSRRLALSCWDLAFSERRILAVALSYGFSTQESFTRAFKKRFAMTPGQFRTGATTRAITAPDPRNEGDDVAMNTVNFPSRVVLRDVMKVGFYTENDRCPENVPFPSCLASVMRYLGEDYPWLPLVEHNKTWRLNYANVHFIGATGMAFGFLWREGWHLDNVDHMFVAPPGEVIDRAFKTAGYEYSVIQKEESCAEAVFKQHIKESINRGTPVLAFGVIGPPECCIITGYDDDGDVLIGWNYFQTENEHNEKLSFEDCGYFRKENWFDGTWSLITVGNKIADFDTSLTNRNMLAWAVTTMQRSELYGRHCGFAAQEQWRTQLLEESHFSGLDDAALQRYHRVHDTAIGVLAECRYWASFFLRHIASEEPSIQYELNQAAAHFKHVHDLMWKMWDICGGNMSPDAWKQFGRRDIRGKLAEVVQEAKEADQRALTAMMEALSR